MITSLKPIANEIVKREKLNITPGEIEKASEKDLFDFIQFYGHETMDKYLRPKKFFNDTSLLLLKLIAEDKIDIIEIAAKELGEREKRN